MSRMTRRTIIPVNQITPLTYRDGVTYIQMLTQLSEYIKGVLHPSLQHTVDQVVADVEAQMDKHHDQYVDGVQEFQRIHDAFMSDVNAKLIALNDGSMADVIQDDTSLLSQTLRSLFIGHGEFERLSGDVRFEMERHRVSTENTFKEFETEVSGEIQRVENTVSEHGQHLNGVSHRVERLESLFPEHYGANGDDTGDDSGAVQRWADDGNTTLKPGSTYRLSQPIRIARDHVAIFGNGATIHPVNVDGFAFYITGDYATVEGVIITGHDGFSRGGVNVQGDYAQVKNNHVRNLHSTGMGAYGIRLSATRGGHHVSGNTVRNISGVNEGTLDGSTGVARGVYMNTQGRNESAEDRTFITDNLIDGIYGLEGDGIQILLNQHPQETGPRDNAVVTISNNVVDNCSRRCVKIQGSHVDVVNNVIRDSRREVKKHRQPSIDIILSAQVHVLNNDIDVGGMSGGIYYSGLYNRASHIVIMNNTVRCRVNHDRVLIRVDNVLYSSIDQNVLIGGRRGVVLRNVSVSSVSRNTIHSISPEGSNPAGLVAERSCSNVYMVGNVDMTWHAGHNSVVNQSDGGVSRNNVAVGR